jgi:hypothetical protein
MSNMRTKAVVALAFLAGIAVAALAELTLRPGNRMPTKFYTSLVDSWEVH